MYLAISDFESERRPNVIELAVTLEAIDKAHESRTLMAGLEYGRFSSIVRHAHVIREKASQEARETTMKEDRT